jgi:ribosomal protein L15E
MSSGIYAWLQQAIIERIGDEQGRALIEEARQHGDKKYQWMQARIVELGHPDIKEGCQQRIRDDARARYIAGKQRTLAGLKKQLEAGTSPKRADWLRQRIKKLERELKV